jgi:hypothetical protein
MRIVPHVGEPVMDGRQPVSLFLVTYTQPGTPPPQLSLEFALDGSVIARSEAALPAPDAEGRIPYVATVPGTHFAPGRYEVRVQVAQGDQRAQESAFFRVTGGAQ